MMSVKGTGWISLGVADNPTMTDADYITGWVIGNNVYIYDTWTVGESLPPADTELGGTDDITLIRGEEKDGVTTIVFSRPLDTGDTAADAVIINGDMVGSLEVSIIYVLFSISNTHITQPMMD